MQDTAAPGQALELEHRKKSLMSYQSRTEGDPPHSLRADGIHRPQKPHPGSKPPLTKQAAAPHPPLRPPRAQPLGACTHRHGQPPAPLHLAPALLGGCSHHRTLILLRTGRSTS